VGPRHIGIHLPAGVGPARLPVLVAFDGNLSRTVLGIPATVDSLTAAGRIAPMVIVFVHTPDDRRAREPAPEQSIVDHVADEVLPWSVGAGASAAARTATSSPDPPSAA
jgi:enterochelin esterase family protein